MLNVSANSILCELKVFIQLYSVDDGLKILLTCQWLMAKESSLYTMYLFHIMQRFT